MFDGGRANRMASNLNSSSQREKRERERRASRCSASARIYSGRAGN